jgi:hypothetical protein
VNLDTSPAAIALREKKATTIQAKILSDATRFTYGDAHMEDPLKSLKLAPRGMGPPELVNLAEFVTPEGEYALTMRFFAPNTPYRVWKDRAPRLARFFGPGVRATLKKYDAATRLVEMSLITTPEVRSRARQQPRPRSEIGRRAYPMPLGAPTEGWCARPVEGLGYSFDLRSL